MWRARGARSVDAGVPTAFRVMMGYGDLATAAPALLVSSLLIVMQLLAPARPARTACLQ